MNLQFVADVTKLQKSVFEFKDRYGANVSRGESIFTQSYAGPGIFQNPHAAGTRLFADEESDGVGTNINRSQSMWTLIHHD